MGNNRQDSSQNSPDTCDKRGTAKPTLPSGARVRPGSCCEAVEPCPSPPLFLPAILTPALAASWRKALNYALCSCSLHTDTAPPAAVAAAGVRGRRVHQLLYRDQPPCPCAYPPCPRRCLSWTSLLSLLSLPPCASFPNFSCHFAVINAGWHPDEHHNGGAIP